MKGHLQPRGRNAWRLYVELARDPITHARRQRTQVFNGTRRQAETALAQMVADATGGRWNGDTRKSVGYLVTHWLDFKAPNLTPNTLRGYRSKIDTIIIPELGDFPFAELDADILDSLYARLRKGTRQRPALAPNSIRRVHAILHAALAQAVRWRWITTNPATEATPPSVAPKDELDLDAELIIKLLNAAPAPTLGDAAFLAAITGLRVGELVGLRWGDLDTTARTLAVRRRVMVDGTVRAKTKNTKTRALGLDRRSVARLRLRRLHARRRARACGIELDERAYIFSETADGLTPVLPGIISQRWTKHRIRMGVDLTLHGLRHFHASILLDSGVQLGRVSSRLGHARQSTTSDIYSHILRANDHDLANIAAAGLRKRKPATG